MRRSVDFSTVVRTGRRARRGGVVIAHLTWLEPRADLTAPPEPRPALVGFIVGRSVGGSVVRHRTTRRLRAILARHVPELPSGSATVVRALPAAATSPSARLAEDVSAALDRVMTERLR